MGVVNPTADPANVVQALVYTLLDVFDATQDLYTTLKNKERRDYENSLRSKGYPDSRRIEYADEDLDGDEAIVLDKAAVTRQFENGYQEVGAQFAIGDVVSQTCLQSQIITLQSVIITTFLYGPTSPDPISHQVASLVAASRAAGTSSVDILAAQHKRQVVVLPLAPRRTRSPAARPKTPQALPYPRSSLASGTSASTALVRSGPGEIPDVSAGLSNPTIADVKGRPHVTRTDTESTSFSGPTAYGTETAPHTKFCLYALDLQRHPSQTLSSTITSSSSPYCPYCRRELKLAPGKSWEIFKQDRNGDRCFRIQNRFVVKCHRNSVDGGYSCSLCSRGASVDTICGDVRALVRHVWMDHSANDLESEDDIVEVVEKAVDRRRDSGMSMAESRKGSGRSVSLGPRRRERRRSIFEREA